MKKIFALFLYMGFNYFALGFDTKLFSAFMIGLLPAFFLLKNKESMNTMISCAPTAKYFHTFKDGAWSCDCGSIRNNQNKLQTINQKEG